jgi:hypothetical protein
MNTGIFIQRGVVDQRVEKDMKWNIFEIIINTSELAMELVNKEFLI